MVASADHRDQINHAFFGGRIRRHCPERDKIGARQDVAKHQPQQVEKLNGIRCIRA